ncbi:MAG TPA: hypothetical protein VH817_15020 [Thermoleophilaceae bacterium]
MPAARRAQTPRAGLVRIEDRKTLHARACGEDDHAGRPRCRRFDEDSLRAKVVPVREQRDEPVVGHVHRAARLQRERVQVRLHLRPRAYICTEVAEPVDLLEAEEDGDDAEGE